jgi:hypothetical protein
MNVLDNIADEIISDLSGDETVLLGMEFLRKASSVNLWDKSIDYSHNPMTIFVPEKYAGGEKLFYEMWRRHTVRGIVKIGSDGVQQLTTLAKIAYALYTTTISTVKKFFIGGVPIGSLWNVQYNGCMFHGVAAPALADLRPLAGYTSRLGFAYVAGDVINLLYMASGIDPEEEANNFSLFVTITKADRMPLAEIQKMPWHGNGTACNIVLPHVDARTEAMVWIALYDNHIRHPIITTTLHWYIIIEPNPLLQPNPHISAINPEIGVANTELWIIGSGFSDKPNVTFDDQTSQVIRSTTNMIRCFIPPGKGKVTIWVANGPVYTRYDSFTYASRGSLH